MIQVLGRANSVNVQKVMWCAHELALEVTRVDVGGRFGGNDTEEFLGDNPNGKIPVLKDGEFTLWESNAIVRYLCNRYNRLGWAPDCPMKHGVANQWMDWYLTTLHAPATVIFWQLIRTAPQNRDPVAITQATQLCADLWSMVDQHLATREFIAGDQISMADIPLGCAAYRWHMLDVARPALPHLENWYGRLRDRPAYRANVMHPLT